MTVESIFSRSSKSIYNQLLSTAFIPGRQRRTTKSYSETGETAATCQVDPTEIVIGQTESRYHFALTCNRWVTYWRDLWFQITPSAPCNKTAFSYASLIQVADGSWICWPTGSGQRVGSLNSLP